MKNRSSTLPCSNETTSYMRVKLGIPLSLQQIAKDCGGEIRRTENLLITHISTDSREINNSDLFIAISGNRYNGANFIDQAKQGGALILSSNEDKSDIFHQNTRQALLNLAANYIGYLPYLLYKIGITGSVGKTTTKEFLKKILSQKYSTHASEGNFNNEIGMPMSVLSAPIETEILVMEMGMSGPGEISLMSKCLAPDLGIITNIGSAHIGLLGSRENIAKAKMELSHGIKNGKIIVLKDEELLSKLENKITCSTTDITADYCIKRTSNSKVNIYVNGQEYCTSNFALHEDHHLKCLASAVSATLLCGITEEQLGQGISSISLDNTRQTLFSAENLIFHNDCYNASLESMIAAIKEFVLSTPEGKRSLLLGDVLETGNMREAIHNEIGECVSGSNINYLFLFGPNAFEIANGAIKFGFPDERISIISDISKTSDMADLIKRLCPTGEHILVKASRAIGLERILEHFSRET